VRTIAFIGIFVISLGIFFTPAPACSQTLTLGNTEFIISTETKFGLLYGEGEEIVYGAPSGAAYLSQLLWDMKPLFYFGAGVSLAVKNPSWPVGLYTGLSVKAGFPGTSGSMEDRDWLDDDNQYLTNFSTHTNNTISALFLDYDLGVSIPIRLKGTYTMDLTVFGRLSWMNLEWLARDGYTQYGSHTTGSTDYGPWDPSLPKNAHSGPAIRYRQTWLMVAPGVTLDFPVLNLFSIGVSFTVSPLIWASAEDFHLIRNLQFNDYPRWGISLEPRLEFVYSPGDRLALSLYASYRYISGARGDIYQNNNPLLRTLGGAGAGYNALDAGLSLNITL
jgi:outer membrane protease